MNFGLSFFHFFFRYPVHTYTSFPPCEVSVVSSSPDVDTESMPPLTCIIPPHHQQPQELCPPTGSYGPPPAQSHEMAVGQHLLYSSSTGAGPFSSPSDSMLSESDLESFQNGHAADSPRSTSSTSSPLHQNSGSGKQQQQPPSALGPPVLRSNQYKSVITATNVQTPPGGAPTDFINPRLTKQQQFQQRTFASCSPANSPYNDSCYFETARQQQQPQQPHMDSGIKYALSKCDSYADKTYCITSTNGASEYSCTADGVQPQYTSVIVDAQQYQMANGFVH